MNEHGSGWGIDVSTGREILVHDGCSVIEAEDAHYILALIAADLAAQEDHENDDD